ncbi:MAG: hypothetical protein V4543_02075 [Bacteroidota bacterium]
MKALRFALGCLLFIVLIWLLVFTVLGLVSPFGDNLIVFYLIIFIWLIALYLGFYALWFKLLLPGLNSFGRKAKVGTGVRVLFVSGTTLIALLSLGYFFWKFVMNSLAW